MSPLAPFLLEFFLEIPTGVGAFMLGAHGLRYTGFAIAQVVVLWGGIVVLAFVVMCSLIKDSRVGLCLGICGLLSWITMVLGLNIGACIQIGTSTWTDKQGAPLSTSWG